MPYVMFTVRGQPDGTARNEDIHVFDADGVCRADCPSGDGVPPKLRLTPRATVCGHCGMAIGWEPVEERS